MSARRKLLDIIGMRNIGENVVAVVVQFMYDGSMEEKNWVN